MADQFPTLLKQAAETYSDNCTAYAQLRYEASIFKVRIQATEIMKQFVGDVTWGKDPEGLLFYNDAGDFGVEPLEADFQYFRYPGPNGIITILINFGTPGSHFARFLARVDTKIHPEIPHYSEAKGNGWWSTYKAATTQVDALRQTVSSVFSLTLGPIRKRATFDTAVKGQLAGPGVVLFQRLDHLKDFPEDGYTQLQADYAPDRVVLFAKATNTQKRKDYALFIPNKPLALGSSTQGREPLVTIKEYNPPSEKATIGEDEEEEAV
jgi:hypothetical protein